MDDALEVPEIIEGGIAFDDRGSVRHFNNLDMVGYGIKRMYAVENHQVGFIRAWHAHKVERKIVALLHGAALVCAIRVTGWSSTHPRGDVSQMTRVTLTGHKPQMLVIPPGYANGFKTLLPDTQVIFFSDRSLTESLADDYRFAWDTDFAGSTGTMHKNNPWLEVYR